MRLCIVNKRCSDIIICFDIAIRKRLNMIRIAESDMPCERKLLNLSGEE